VIRELVIDTEGSLNIQVYKERIGDSEDCASYEYKVYKNGFSVHGPCTADDVIRALGAYLIGLNDYSDF
jgi:hypothetical protein